MVAKKEKERVLEEAVCCQLPHHSTDLLIDHPHAIEVSGVGVTERGRVGVVRCQPTTSGGTVVGVSSCLRGKWRELSCDCPKDCMWKNGVCLSGRVRQLAFGEDTFQSRLIGSESCSPSCGGWLCNIRCF
ncbi:MAG: hypothetical protein CM1200mP2_56460 [Planctomycetaceae bacterium]|nr:MAG: hypothetical protein CM1200mP2_56460 [Planctomycetaceae bacterium]